ncbi:MAG: type II toxin-antitoxin system RelE/ParE family toxin [Bacteroidia bacterium]|nr:type II toxin-antitoxin system RelE/ParE family toxin [Bacteroidia bacterium]
MVKLKVVWDELARSALKNAYHYINQDSLQQAERVKQEIMGATKKLADNPKMYPPDKYRKDKDGRFRAFEKDSYRISYFIAENSIRVLRFRHVKKQPKEY